MPEEQRPEWQTLMSAMPTDPQGVCGHRGTGTGRLETWDEHAAWLERLFDMHHGEAVILPPRPQDQPWVWQGLGDLRNARLVPHSEAPVDVAFWLSQRWPFSHHSYQWNFYDDQPAFGDTMTTAQDSQVFVPCVGADQPCRILARPSDAGLSEGAWILKGDGVLVTNLAMMVYALGRHFTMAQWRPSTKSTGPWWCTRRGGDGVA